MISSKRVNLDEYVICIDLYSVPGRVLGSGKTGGKDMVSILGSLGSLELLVDLHCREAAMTGALWFCGYIYTHTHTHTHTHTPWAAKVCVMV